MVKGVMRRRVGWGQIQRRIKLEGIRATEIEVKHRYSRKIKRGENTGRVEKWRRKKSVKERNFSAWSVNCFPDNPNWFLLHPPDTIWVSVWTYGPRRKNLKQEWQFIRLNWVHSFTVIIYSHTTVVVPTKAILEEYLFKDEMGPVVVALPFNAARTLRSRFGIPQESASVLPYIGSGPRGYILE